MHKAQREALKIAEAEGLTILGQLSGSKHMRLDVRTPDGRSERITIPGSPSDHRAMLNFRKHCRHLVRNVQA